MLSQRNVHESDLLSNFLNKSVLYAASVVIIFHPLWTQRTIEKVQSKSPKPLNQALVSFATVNVYIWYFSCVVV